VSDAWPVALAQPDRHFGWAAPTPLAQAASLDTTADRVFGQPDFSQHGFNDGGLSAASLDTASGVALDRQGNLYVADNGNNRLLEYDALLSTEPAAAQQLPVPT